MAGAVSQSTVSGGVAVTSQSAFTGIKSVSGANYTVLDDDGYDLIEVPNNGTARTVTLPTAADNSGRRLVIQKTGSDSSSVTIDGEGAETVGGFASYTLYAQYDSITIQCDGTLWLVVGQVSNWVSCTITGSWVSNTTYAGRCRRHGNDLECEAFVSVSGAPTSATLTLTLPNSWTISTTLLSGGSPSNLKTVVGQAQINDTGTTAFTGVVMYNSSTTVQLRCIAASGSYGETQVVNQAAPMTFANGDSVQAQFRVPISNWT